MQLVLYYEIKYVSPPITEPNLNLSDFRDFQSKHIKLNFILLL